MKTRGLIALLLVTAVAVAVAALSSLGSGAGAVDPRIDQVVLPALRERLSDVARVSLRQGENKTTLERKGDAWQVEEKGGYPADALKVKQVVGGLADLRYVEAKTRKAEFYPRLEVEDPGKKEAKSTLITVSDAQGTPLGELIAGKHRFDELGGGTDGVYVRSPSDAQAWLARGSLDLPADTTGWLDRKLVDLPHEKVKEVVLTQPDGSSLDIFREKPEDKLALKGAPADVKLKSDTALVEPTTALASLTLSDVRPASEMPLPAEGVAHAEVTSFDGLTLKLALIDKDGKSWVHVEATGTGEAEKSAQDLNARLKPWMFAVPDYKAKLLRIKLADLTAPPASK